MQRPLRFVVEFFIHRELFKREKKEKLYNRNISLMMWGHSDNLKRLKRVKEGENLKIGMLKKRNLFFRGKFNFKVNENFFQIFHKISANLIHLTFHRNT